MTQIGVQENDVLATIMKHVIILHNEIPQDASEDVLDILRQAQWIQEILSSRGYEATLCAFSLSSLASLDKQAIIFNLVDATDDDPMLCYLGAGMLEQQKLPYTGCTLPSLFLTTDKMVAKQLMQNAGLPVPCFFSDHVQKGTFLIKPKAGDASIGLDESCLVSFEHVQQVLAQKEAQLGLSCFAEEYIEGREFTVCMYGSETECFTLPPYEWVFNQYQGRAKLITYDAKWTEHTYGYEHIEPKYSHDSCDASLLASLEKLSRQCWDLFGLCGYARVDFRIDTDNKPYILEVNGNPSFYGFYHLAKVWGFSFEDLVAYLVEHPRYR